MSLSKKIVNKCLINKYSSFQQQQTLLNLFFCTTKHKRDITRLLQKIKPTLFQGTHTLKDFYGLYYGNNIPV